MTAQNFELIGRAIMHADHNADFYNAAMQPEKMQPHIKLATAYGTKTAEFNFPLTRDEKTHAVSAIEPLGGSVYGRLNAEAFTSLGFNTLGAMRATKQLIALANTELRHHRTEEDKIAEGLEGVKADILNMYELEQHGARYDGDEYDPDDDFHQWLIDNNFAEVETDDDNTEEKTLSLAYDWRDRLSDYFGNYFLDVTIANNDEGTALCVEAFITVGGPHVAIEQFMGRGYVLKYSWGGLSESYSFDSELDSWLDDMLGTFTGEY